MNTKEGALNSAVFLYVMRCLTEGDVHALRHMQFGRKELDAIRELSVFDLSRSENLRAHCLSISLNRKVFWPMIEMLKRERLSESTLNELIERDAPYELMHELFGMSTREYTHRRRHLPASLGQGRPKLPEKAREEVLYGAWRDLVEGNGSASLNANDYLDLHKHTEVSLRAIWQLTSQWRVEERDIN